ASPLVCEPVIRRANRRSAGNSGSTCRAIDITLLLNSGRLARTATIVRTRRFASNLFFEASGTIAFDRRWPQNTCGERAGAPSRGADRVYITRVENALDRPG